MLTNHVGNVYPYLEKFWITLENQAALGGVDWVIDNAGNKSVTIPFDGYERDPYAINDEKYKFEVKMIRFIMDSEILKYVPDFRNITELEIILVRDHRALVFPEKDYLLYFPTTNSLATQFRGIPIDERVWDVTQSVMIIKYDINYLASPQTLQAPLQS